MKHRILTIHPILPRPAIGLISLRLSLNEEGARKEFSYTPLALFFRRTHELTTQSTHSTNYISQDGVNVIIAPRFEFTIQLAFSLGLHSSHPFLFTHQNRKESDVELSIPHPVIARSYLKLTKVRNQQDRIEIEPTLLVSSGMARHNPSLIGSNYYRSLKQTLGNFLLSLISARDELHPMKVKKQSVWDEKSFRLSLWSLISRNYKTLAIPDNKTPSRVINSVFNVKENVEVRPSHLLIRSSIATNYQFSQRSISKVTRCLKTSFSKRQIERLNEAYSNSQGLFTSYASASDYSKELRGSESWNPPFSSREGAMHKRKSGAVNERFITPVQVSYRKEKPPQFTSAAPDVKPTLLPMNPPKIDIDRLSRDVWNKIEKRIRIERERHGRL